MAKLHIYQTIENGEYAIRFTIEPGSLTSSDTQALDQYGEPTIDFGGDIPVADPTIEAPTPAVLFSLPSTQIKMISGLTFKKVIDITVAPWDTDTATRLQRYRETIQYRYKSMMSSLKSRLLADTFTNEFITSL